MYNLPFYLDNYFSEKPSLADINCGDFFDTINVVENYKEDKVDDFINRYNIFNQSSSHPNLFDTGDTSKINSNSSNIDFYFQKSSNIIKDNKKININDTQLKKPRVINNNLENNHLGRKRKNSKEKRFHTKYFDDNKTSKVKIIIIKEVMDFINKQLRNDYGDNLKGLQLLKLKQNKNNTVKYNKEFLNKSLNDIFSDKINGKYQNYPQYHNKNVINELLNENDEIKRKKYTDIFNLTFLDCLQYYTETPTQHSKELLSGMKTVNDIKIEDDDDDKKYKKELKYFIVNFIKIINEKKGRERKKI